MAGGSLYYWDTCLFLAWINDENRKTGEMDGVRDVVEKARRREVKLLTSVLTTVELLECKLPVGFATVFRDFMKRVERVNIDPKVANLAHDLRNHYMVRRGEFQNKTLSTPDALHLATAILYRADEFHTFDEEGSGKSLGLIPLSNDVGGHRLRICKPETRSPSLNLRRP